MNSARGCQYNYGQLQWGRVAEDAEILLGILGVGVMVELQWGRVTEDAEI